MSPPLDDLLELGESEAVWRHFDGANLTVLRRLLAILAFASVVALLAQIGGVEPRALVAALASLFLTLALYRSLREPKVYPHVRQIAEAFLVLQFALLMIQHGPLAEGFRIWSFMLPVALVFVRMRTSEYLLVQGVMFAISTAGPFVAMLLAEATVSAADAIGSTEIVGYVVLHVSVLAVATTVTRRSRKRFVSRWNAEVEHNRDRLRMKQELEHAREIQLSMLPRNPPPSDWIDVASLSLPATEVGGDYYDYFQPGDGCLSVVVGDVAGHGVAAGLVLSGVRSSLNLLDRELAHPAEVLARLNRMVHRTSPRRMIVALLVAVLDPERRRLTVAAAGHPPALRYDAAAGSISELTPGSLPLGARSDTTYEVREVALAPGDVLLMCTDGVAETVDGEGEQYGYERLATRFQAAAGRGRARDVRDEILRDLWSFKGTAEQVDDVTMVVVRVRDMHAGEP